MKNSLYIFFFIFLTFGIKAQWRISAPAQERYCTINPKGETIIP
ncbi:MAG: hypothetical protein RIS73_131, partial [Bacteroidota bacterium]